MMLNKTTLFEDPLYSNLFNSIPIKGLFVSSFLLLYSYICVFDYFCIYVIILPEVNLNFDIILCQTSLPKELWQFTESVLWIRDCKNFGSLVPWILFVLISVRYLLIQISIFLCCVFFSDLFFICLIIFLYFCLSDFVVIRSF